MWTNTGWLRVGNYGNSNTLVINNGGKVIGRFSVIGSGPECSNNYVLVTDTGSVWSNVTLDVGESGSGNSLVIGNGGKVFSEESSIGFVSSNNNVLVTGTGSVWSNDYELDVGAIGSGNSLMVNNGGKVFDYYGRIGGNNGYGGNGSNNSVVVSGSGSVWSNQNGSTSVIEGAATRW